MKRELDTLIDARRHLRHFSSEMAQKGYNEFYAAIADQLESRILLAAAKEFHIFRKRNFTEAWETYMTEPF